MFYVSDFLKSHLQVDCLSRKECMCYSAINIERDLDLHKIVRGVILNYYIYYSLKLYFVIKHVADNYSN